MSTIPNNHKVETLPFIVTIALCKRTYGATKPFHAIDLIKFATTQEEGESYALEQLLATCDEGMLIEGDDIPAEYLENVEGHGWRQLRRDISLSDLQRVIASHEWYDFTRPSATVHRVSEIETVAQSRDKA